MIGVGDFIVTDEMRANVNDVLDSGRISYGKYSRQFEDEFSIMHGCDFGVLSNSGTSSLHVALQALKELGGWEDGDEVIVPSVTFVATVNVVLHNNLTPVFVDVHPYSYNMDMQKVAEVITNRTRAIIPVHLFGQPANMLRLSDVLRMVDRMDIKVIEDSCECMLATHNGRMVGSWGDVACFSTYVAHIITTGVGGIATTNDAELAIKMRSLVNHGRDSIYLTIDDNEGRTEEVVKRRFQFTSIGHSFRITELEAALGVAQLKGLGDNIHRRGVIADMYWKGLLDLGESKLVLPRILPGNSHSFMMYPLVVIDKSEKDKWGLVNWLEENDIETREMLPLTNQPVYRDLLDESGFPIARWINERGFYLPCHPGLEYGDVEYIIGKIEEYFNGRD